MFTEHADVGAVQHPGSVAYEPKTQTYQVSGGGENMWAGTDAFHFIWTRLSGDFTLAAEVRWPRAGGNAHRKACLMLRQSLTPEAPYVDAAVHGNGLTSLQFREVPGGLTREVQANVTQPDRVRLERRGETVMLSVAEPGEKFRFSGCSFRLRLSDPVYVGLAVCAHDNRVVETASFGHVSLVTGPAAFPGKAVRHSTLGVVPTGSRDRRVVYGSTNLLEAPNGSPDGQ